MVQTFQTSLLETFSIRRTKEAFGSADDENQLHYSNNVLDMPTLGGWEDDRNNSLLTHINIVIIHFISWLDSVTPVPGPPTTWHAPGLVFSNGKHIISVLQNSSEYSQLYVRPSPLHTRAQAFTLVSFVPCAGLQPPKPK